MHPRNALLLGALLLAPCGCRLTSHPVAPSPLGAARTGSDLEAVVAQPGPVEVETVVGADWSVERSGLINLHHPRATAAHLEDGLEPIVISFHALRHPTKGLYLIDTGVERALRDDPGHAAVRGLVASVMGIDRLVVRKDTRSWLDAQSDRPAGVFLTHLHPDHVTGMRDIAAETPVFVGPGETADRSFRNLAVAPVLDDALEGKPALREWPFAPDPGGAFLGVVDIFGDASVWAIRVPGHTRGSTAYLARTPRGPVLFVGDASHTVWGWENGVEPGTFSSNILQGADSLARLRAFVARHPTIEVRLGHQFFPKQAAARASAAGQP